MPLPTHCRSGVAALLARHQQKMQRQYSESNTEAVLGHAGSNCAPRTTWGQYCLAVWRTMHATLPAADGVDPTRVLPHHGSNVAPLPLEDKAACLLLYHGRRWRHFNSCRHTTRTEQFQERYWERRGVDEYAWNCLVPAGWRLANCCYSSTFACCFNATRNRLACVQCGGCVAFEPRHRHHDGAACKSETVLSPGGAGSAARTCVP